MDRGGSVCVGLDCAIPDEVCNGLELKEPMLSSIVFIENYYCVPVASALSNNNGLFLSLALQNVWLIPKFLNRAD
jgi:hypothetical protein